MSKHTPKPQPTPSPSPSPLARTAHQTFRYQEIERDLIQKAPYNPRVIEEDASARLRANIARVGLLTTLVWNTRTGNLVSGHQRLTALDDLHGGSTAYRLGVAVIDVDEATERELNVFLNNWWAQGEYDPEQLLALIGSLGGGVDVVTAMGWAADEMLLEFGSREELLSLVPENADAGEPVKTAQDTMGPHVLIVFRNNDDKQQMLAHLDRTNELRRMSADELLLYIAPEHRWRELDA